MEVVGYAASLMIGISLGLIGGGGSVLTLPVMVYLFGLQPLVATSYSLFIVGSTSMIGALNNLRKGLVNLKAVLFFGTTSIATVFVTRKFIVHAIPDVLFSIGDVAISGSLLTMVLFAVFMLLASLSMILRKKTEVHDTECRNCIRNAKLLGYGVSIGLITGFLGAGGGFLLIPALVIVLKLPMKVAVGTSLMIIGLNSLIGFTGDLGYLTINWFLLIKITAIAIAGIFIGGALGKKIQAEKLKKLFGWFVLVMGMYILLKEMLFK